MNFLELAKKRFSARSYKADKVEKEKLDYIMECARVSPSAVNYQPCRFLIVESEEGRAKMQECYPRDWFVSASIYVAVCVDESVAWTRKEDGKSHADIDAAIVAEHICLAASDAGLGSCWVCNFKVDVFEKNFPLPSSVHPVAIIPLGYVDKYPEHPSSRNSLCDVVTVL